MATDPRAPIASGPVRPSDLDEVSFQAVMGRWEATPPGEVARLLTDVPFSWWIAGGWALELAGGRSRPHGDTDVAFLLRDLPTLRRELTHLHLWAPGPDRLRPVLPGTCMDADEEQLWVRRDAAGPWILDLLATPTDGDRWVFKKDARIRRPLDDVGWTTHTGIPVLAPEVVLLHKAGQNRERDRGDLHAVRPRLTDEARRWLRDSLDTCWPGHPWVQLLSPTSDVPGA